MGTRTRIPPLMLGSLLLTQACFVNEGDCETSGVRIEPCAVPAKIGQTRRLSASLITDPAQDITWGVPNAALEAFDISFEGNTMQLVGKLGVAGAYRFRAESAADSNLFGEATVSVGVPFFGYPPPPIQIFGGDFPNDYQAAVASGGDRTYVAYADLVEVVGRGGGTRAVVSFVRQFDARTNRPLAQVDDAFALYDGVRAAPNVAADAQGNGYWIDFVANLDVLGFNPRPRIRRLARNGAQPESQELEDFCDAGPLVVARDGTLYFIGQRFSTDCSRELFRIRPFGSPPQVIDAPLVQVRLPVVDVFASMTIDSEDRLLFGGQRDDFFAGDTVVRFLPDPVQATAALDEGFTFEPVGVLQVNALAADAGGIVYAAVTRFCDSEDFLDPDPDCSCDPKSSRKSILLLDSLGRSVRERKVLDNEPVDLPVRIDCYEYQCPENCIDERCGTQILFDSIRSIAVTPDGRLQVVDDVTLDLAADDPCQVQVRIVLIDS